jgi:hypothetical protein
VLEWSVLEQAAGYWQDAARFRRMAETEPDGRVRQRLVDISEQYEGLADRIAARRHNGA